MKNLYKNEQSGRSMVEMLGVLAIIGVLSIGGIAGYSKAMAKFRVNKTLDQISMLVMNIRSLYSANINYKGLTDKIAIQMGIIPRDMLPSGTNESTASSIINAYQGEVRIGSSNIGGTDRSFFIVYSGLTRDACVAIATADWGSQAGSGLQSIQIKAATAGTNKAATLKNASGIPCTANTSAAGTGCHPIDSLPVILSEAAAECSNTSDSGNEVRWDYY